MKRTGKKKSAEIIIIIPLKTIKPDQFTFSKD